MFPITKTNKIPFSIFYELLLPKVGSLAGIKKKALLFAPSLEEHF